MQLKRTDRRGSEETHRAAKIVASDDISIAAGDLFSRERSALKSVGCDRNCEEMFLKAHSSREVLCEPPLAVQLILPSATILLLCRVYCAGAFVGHFVGELVIAAERGVRRIELDRPIVSGRSHAMDTRSFHPDRQIVSSPSAAVPVFPRRVL